MHTFQVNRYEAIQAYTHNNSSIQLQKVKYNIENETCIRVIVCAIENVFTNFTAMFSHN